MVKLRKTEYCYFRIKDLHNLGTSLNYVFVILKRIQQFLYLHIHKNTPLPQDKLILKSTKQFDSDWSLETALIES